MSWGNKDKNKRPIWRELAKRVAVNILAVLFIVSVAGGLFVWEEYRELRQSLPEPTFSAMHSLPQTSRVYDRNGELLFEVYGDIKRREVGLDQVPAFLRQATIAVEDKDFYNHPGFDVSAIIRAAWVNLKNQDIEQGASTLTQQLARTIFLSREQSYTRKIKEMMLAYEIERRYSKDEILEYYFNNIAYGSNAYGAAVASQYYYNKPVSELNLQESVYLAALPRAPSFLSPFGPRKDELEARANVVLQAMREKGFMTSAAVDYYRKKGPPEFVNSPIEIRAPHFVFYVLEQLERQYGSEQLFAGGLEIRTSLDMRLQQEADRLVKERGEKNEEKFGASNAALVAIDPKTGEVLAMVGSRNFFGKKDGAFNVATSPRQPGSSFKPYVYAAALSRDMNPNTLLHDSRTDFASYNNGIEYIPRNYNGRYYGYVTVRKALAGSLNIPAVKTLVKTGLDEVLGLAADMGINSLENRQVYGPALALGGGDISLLEHTSAMGVFANNGKRQPVAPVLDIKDKNGYIIYSRERIPGRQVLEPGVAYWINDMLSDSQARQYVFGRGSALEIPGRQVAAKTGTTQDYRDGWTVGYTPNLAVGVWVGNNDYSPMKGDAYGLAVAGPIWHDFMEFALKDLPVQEFTRPPGLKDPPPPFYPTEIAEADEEKEDADAGEDSPGLAMGVPGGRQTRAVPEASVNSQQAASQTGKKRESLLEADMRHAAEVADRMRKGG